MAFDYQKYVRNNRLLNENFGGYVDLQPINNPLREELQESDVSEGDLEEAMDYSHLTNYENMAQIIAKKYGEELKKLFGKKRYDMALSHAYQEFLDTKHPKAKTIANNYVWGYLDRDWPDLFIDSLDDILGGGVDSYPGNMGDEMSAPTSLEEAPIGGETLVFDEVKVELDALKNAVGKLIELSSDTGQFEWSEALEKLYANLDKWETAFIAADRKLGPIK